MTAGSVALVGDSLRIDYQPVVVEALLGVADVWGPNVNCESSRHLRAALDDWVLDRLDRPTIVHANAGAHDVRRTMDTDWQVQVPIDEYRDNMVTIFDRFLEHPNVELVIVATTAPVDEARHEAAGSSNRRNSDIEAYNRVLIDAASRRALPINDLWSAIQSCPFDAISADGIHLTQAGNAHLGRQVAQQLRTALEQV